MGMWNWVIIYQISGFLNLQCKDTTNGKSFQDDTIGSKIWKNIHGSSSTLPMTTAMDMRSYLSRWFSNLLRIPMNLLENVLSPLGWFWLNGRPLFFFNTAESDSSGKLETCTFWLINNQRNCINTSVSFFFFLCFNSNSLSMASSSASSRKCLKNWDSVNESV